MYVRIADTNSFFKKKMIYISETTILPLFYMKLIPNNSPKYVRKYLKKMYFLLLHNFQQPNKTQENFKIFE